MGPRPHPPTPSRLCQKASGRTFAGLTLDSPRGHRVLWACARAADAGADAVPPRAGPRPRSTPSCRCSAARGAGASPHTFCDPRPVSGALLPGLCLRRRQRRRPGQSLGIHSGIFPLNASDPLRRFQYLSSLSLLLPTFCRPGLPSRATFLHMKSFPYASCRLSHSFRLGIF